LSVCPSDSNNENLRECFYIRKVDYDLVEFITKYNRGADFENERYSYIDSLESYIIKFQVSHTTGEGQALMIRYISNDYGDNYIIQSETVWDDYWYHMEPVILSTLKINHEFPQVN